MTSIADSLRNFVTGLGVPGRDKMAAAQFGGQRMTDGELLAAYRFDWLARKVIDIPADDMTREWRNWQADDEQIEKLEAEERRLDLRAKVATAIKRGRLLGGAAIVLGDGAPDPSKELDPETIQAGGLKYIAVVTRTRLAAGEIDHDPASAGFNEPRVYTLNTAAGQAITLHPSRVIRFLGQEVPEDLAPETQGWGDSVLDGVRQALADAGMTTQGVAALIQDARTDVITVKGLTALMATREGRDQVSARWGLNAFLRSSQAVSLVDENEQWQQRSQGFADLSDLVGRYLQIVAGAADIPATRLLSQSPMGMNATGESDMRNHYDRIGSEQRVFLDPRLARIDDCLIRSALGSRPDEVHYEWAPLYRQTPKEKAETAKLRADTTAVYVNTGTVPLPVLEKVVQTQLVEDGVYPGLEQAMKEAEEEGLLDPENLMGGPGGPLDPNVALPGGRIDPRTGAPIPAPGARRPAVGAVSPRAVAGRRAAPVRAAGARDAAQTLYVHRPVLNADEIRQWAREQGFKTTLEPVDLHVTVAFSRRAFDWQALPPRGDTLSIDNGMSGWRWVTRMGDGPLAATVLQFEDEGLRKRWQQFIDAGASWDWGHYAPHVTLSYQADYLEPWELNAFLGRIELGPEVFSTIREEGAPALEVSTDPAEVTS